jgi:hypothetical protein
MKILNTEMVRTGAKINTVREIKTQRDGEKVETKLKKKKEEEE